MEYLQWPLTGGDPPLIRHALENNYLLLFLIISSGILWKTCSQIEATSILFFSQKQGANVLNLKISIFPIYFLSTSSKRKAYCPIFELQNQFVPKSGHINVEPEIQDLILC
jgi:hypothetical protein